MSRPSLIGSNCNLTSSSNVAPKIIDEDRTKYVLVDVAVAKGNQTALVNRGAIVIERRKGSKGITATVFNVTLRALCKVCSALSAQI